MSKKKAPRSSNPKSSAREISAPDTSVLARYSPTDGPGSHPDWIKTKFPGYINPHAGHEKTSVREFTHAGHVVRIITTYRIEADGQEVQAHLSVDEDGRVFTHALPFATYASAVDLMKDVLDAYSEDFSEAPDAPGGPVHDHTAGQPMDAGHHQGMSHGHEMGHDHGEED